MARYCPRCGAPITSLASNGGTCSNCLADQPGMPKNPYVAALLGLIGPLGMVYVSRFWRSLAVVIAFGFVVGVLSVAIHVRLFWVSLIPLHLGLAGWGYARAMAINRGATE